MKLDSLRTLVKEELSKKLNEEYQDKFKMVGMLITNIKKRPQKEIFSDTFLVLFLNYKDTKNN